jgi:hypothetical protein
MDSGLARGRRSRSRPDCLPSRPSLPPPSTRSLAPPRRDSLAPPRRCSLAPRRRTSLPPCVLALARAAHLVLARPHEETFAGPARPVFAGAQEEDLRGTAKTHFAGIAPTPLARPHQQLLGAARNGVLLHLDAGRSRPSPRRSRIDRSPTRHHGAALVGAHAFDDDLPRPVHDVRASAHAVDARRTDEVLAHGLGRRHRKAERTRFPGRDHDRAFPGAFAMELGRAVGHVLFPFDDFLAPAFADGEGFLPRQKRDVTRGATPAVPRYCGRGRRRRAPCRRTCGPRPACSMGPMSERTLSHSGSPHGAGSRRENSTRPERTILAKKPSFDFRPISTKADEDGLPIWKNQCRSPRSTRWSK